MNAAVIRSDYRRISREAVPVNGDCYDCDVTWTGPASRDSAAVHRQATGHATWVECKPMEAE